MSVGWRLEVVTTREWYERKNKCYNKCYILALLFLYLGCLLVSALLSTIKMDLPPPHCTSIVKHHGFYSEGQIMSHSVNENVMSGLGRETMSALRTWDHAISSATAPQFWCHVTNSGAFSWLKKMYDFTLLYTDSFWLWNMKSFIIK